MRVWIRIRYVSKPVLIRIRFPSFLRKYRERSLKRAPNTALRSTHARENVSLRYPPFDYSECLLDVSLVFDCVPALHYPEKLSFRHSERGGQKHSSEQSVRHFWPWALRHSHRWPAEYTLAVDSLWSLFLDNLTRATSP